jgi:hypothetical protein
LKNLLTGFLRGVAVMVLIIEGMVNWSYGVPMVLGGLLGGYVGGMISGRADRRFLRALIIIIGFGVAAYYFWNVYAAPISRIGGEKRPGSNIRTTARTHRTSAKGDQPSTRTKT